MMNEDIKEKAGIILDNAKDTADSINLNSLDKKILEFNNTTLIRKNLEDRIIECHTEYVVNANAIHSLVEGIKHISSTIDRNNIKEDDINGLTVLNNSIGAINDALENLEHINAETFTLAQALDRYNKLTGYNPPE